MKKFNLCNPTISVLAILFLAWTAQSAPGDLDTAFGNGGKVVAGFGRTVDSANAVATQSDGKIVVAGNSGKFQGTSPFPSFPLSLSPVTVARYNADGSPDTTFDGDGKVFTAFDISNSRTTVDTKAIGIQSDGKIVVSGMLRSQNQTNGNESSFVIIVRYNSDGSLDTSFDGDGIVMTGESQENGNALVIQTDGKIVIIGQSIYRYNSNGSLDTTFGTNGRQVNVDANTGIIQPNGRILTTGGTCTFPPLTCTTQIKRYNTDGSPDTTFDGDGIAQPAIPSVSDIGEAVAYQRGTGMQGNPDKLVIAGSSTNGAFVIRLSLSGTLDTTFDGDGLVSLPFSTESEANAIRFESSMSVDNRIIVSGYTGSGTNFDFFVSKLMLNGTLDTAFDGDGFVITDFGGGNDRGRAMVIRSSRILVVGLATLGTEDFAFAAYSLANGSLDTGFDTDGKKTDDIDNLSATSRGVAIQTDGKLVIVGGIDDLSDQFAVMRLTSTGTLDTTFDGDGKVFTATNGVAKAVAIQPGDGKIVVVGNNSDDFVIVRYNADGSLDTSFGGGDGIVITSFFFGTGADVANAVAIQADGAIVVAGHAVNGSVINFAVARYFSDGTLDSSFDIDGKITVPIGGVEDQGNAMVIDATGRIVVAGSVFNGSNRDFGAIRLNPDGSLDTTFSFDGKVTAPIGTFNDVGNALAIQTNGKIVIAGSTETVSALNINDFAMIRFNENGSLDTSFDTDGKVSTPIGAGNDVGNAVAIQTDGKILVAGTSDNGTNNDYAVVRYNSDGSLDNAFWSSSEGNQCGKSANSADDGKNSLIPCGFSQPLFGNAGRAVFDVSGNNDEAFGLVTDSSGRAVVVGKSNDLFGVIRLLGNAAPTQGFESDVSSRPNGDGSILSDDVVQMRRFLNGTNTPDPLTNEFQRADSDPFATKGGGSLNSADIVQTRRYQNGTSPLQTAGGPTMMGPEFETAELDNLTFELQSSADDLRQMRVENTMTSDGQTITVSILVDAVGDEAEYAFTLNYDGSVLSKPVIRDGNTTATVRACNTKIVGAINCSVGGFTTNNPLSSESGIGEITSGENQILITVQFTVVATAPSGATELKLSDVNAASDAPQLFRLRTTSGKHIPRGKYP